MWDASLLQRDFRLADLVKWYCEEQCKPVPKRVLMARLASKMGREVRLIEAEVGYMQDWARSRLSFHGWVLREKHPGYSTFVSRTRLGMSAIACRIWRDCLIPDRVLRVVYGEDDDSDATSELSVEFEEVDPSQ